MSVIGVFVVIVTVLVLAFFYFLPDIVRWTILKPMKRKVAGKNLILGLRIERDGIEGATDIEVAYCRAKKCLEKLGVTIGTVHHGAARGLRIKQIWRDQIVGMGADMADVVIVGSWAAMRRECQCRRFSWRFELETATYRSNGWREKELDGQMSLSFRTRPRWLTRHRLTQQCLFVLLQGIIAATTGPDPDPQFRHDTAVWPWPTNPPGETTETKAGTC